MTTFFFPHAIDFADGDLLTQLTNVSPAYNFQDLAEFSSGDTSPMWSGSLSSAPNVAFSTRQVKSILDLCDPLAAHGNGKVIAYDAATGGKITVWLRKGEAYGLRESNASVVHEQVVIQKGFLQWSDISAQQNQVAELSCQLVASYDGVNDPLVFSQSALAGSQAVNHLFTLGPIHLNGAALAGLQGYTLSNNAGLNVVFDSGVPFPQYIGIVSFSPTLVARVRYADYMRTIGTRGTAITALNVYLRRLAASALAVADGTAQHIKFASTAGTVKARQVDNTGLVDLFFQLLKPNTTTQPYVWTVDTTIPAI